MSDDTLEPFEIVDLSQRLAKRYKRRMDYFELDELISIINLAIVEGLHSFKRNKQLMHHLLDGVRNSLSKAVKENQMVKLSDDDNTIRLYLLDYQDEYQKDFQCKPSLDELRRVANKKFKRRLKSHQIGQLLNPTVSLHKEVVEGVELLETLVSEAATPEEALERQQQLHMLSVLDPQERTLVQMIFGINCKPLSITVIAKEMKISKAEVNLLQLSAFNKMRQNR